MKKLLFLLALVPTLCQAQYEWDPTLYKIGKRYPGYIVELDGDTVRGYVEALERAPIAGIGRSMQTDCRFFANEADKKPVDTYGPKDIKAYTCGEKIYRSIAYSGGLSNSLGFCLLSQSGTLSIYKYYSCQDGFVGMVKGPAESWEEFDQRRFYINDVYYVDGKKPVDHNGMVLGFAKKMGELTESCPEISEKVNAKEEGWRVGSIYKVIEAFNACGK